MKILEIPFGNLKTLLTRPSVTRIYKCMAFPFAIGLIVLILWYWPCSEADFHFEVTTDYASFDLGDEWQLMDGGKVVYHGVSPSTPSIGEHPIRSIYIENMDQDYFQEKNPFSRLSGKTFEAENAEIQTLTIVPDKTPSNQKAAIELLSTPLSLTIFAKNASISGICTLTGQHAGTAPPETIRFKSQITRDVPTRITFPTSKDQVLVVDTPMVKKLHFGKEKPIGSGEFLSRIISGNLTIITSGREVNLEWADKLYIDHITETRRMSIRQLSEGLRISFLGKAKVLKAGPEGFESDLRPRILEKMYHYTPLLIFLWAYSIIAGALLSLQKEKD